MRHVKKVIDAASARGGKTSTSRKGSAGLHMCLTGGLRTMIRRHAGTAAQDHDVLALAGIGARPAVDAPDVPLLALPCAPLGSSPADDMATSGVDSECELTDARQPAVALVTCA